MAKVQTYTEWTEKDNALHKTYTFDSFLDAIEWMSDCSSQIDEVEHHPQWTNIYNKVHIILQTHEIDGEVLDEVTDKDQEVATILDVVYQAYAN